jgi:uncharacterized protein (DUF302 family)
MNNAVLKRSPMSFTETLKRLRTAIVVGGNTLFADIDQSAAAQGVGLALRPTHLLVFGNPKGGTPLMDAFPLIALDLPLKFLVWEEEGHANVAYTPASVLAQRHAVTGQESRIAAMDHAMETILAQALA